ncbi:hypothetical protein BB558_004536 [Smittium angustum]|uniref:Myb-like domain-containing protein n=1 Tax=Smittium angustum TaxID=133377 RepID=A0A2U1J319_SMIAN|nr:hypothetical protein BB558_004536 [Smittium angustum]
MSKIINPSSDAIGWDDMSWEALLEELFSKPKDTDPFDSNLQNQSDIKANNGFEISSSPKQIYNQKNKIPYTTSSPNLNHTNQITFSSPTILSMKQKKWNLIESKTLLEQVKFLYKFGYDVTENQNTGNRVKINDILWETVAAEINKKGSCKTGTQCKKRWKVIYRHLGDTIMKYICEGSSDNPLKANQSKVDSIAKVHSRVSENFDSEDQIQNKNEPVSITTLQQSPEISNNILSNIQNPQWPTMNFQNPQLDQIVFNQPNLKTDANDNNQSPKSVSIEKKSDLFDFLEGTFFQDERFKSKFYCQLISDVVEAIQNPFSKAGMAVKKVKWQHEMDAEKSKTLKNSGANINLDNSIVTSTHQEEGQITNCINPFDEKESELTKKRKVSSIYPPDEKIEDNDSGGTIVTKYPINQHNQTLNNTFTTKNSFSAPNIPDNPENLQNTVTNVHPNTNHTTETPTEVDYYIEFLKSLIDPNINLENNLVNQHENNGLDWLNSSEIWNGGSSIQQNPEYTSLNISDVKLPFQNIPNEKTEITQNEYYDDTVDDDFICSNSEEDIDVEIDPDTSEEDNNNNESESTVFNTNFFNQDILNKSLLDISKKGTQNHNINNFKVFQNNTNQLGSSNNDSLLNFGFIKNNNTQQLNILAQNNLMNNNLIQQASVLNNNVTSTNTNELENLNQLIKLSELSNSNILSTESLKASNCPNQLTTTVLDASKNDNTNGNKLPLNNTKYSTGINILGNNNNPTKNEITYNSNKKVSYSNPPNNSENKGVSTSSEIAATLLPLNNKSLEHTVNNTVDSSLFSNQKDPLILDPNIMPRPNELESYFNNFDTETTNVDAEMESLYQEALQAGEEIRYTNQSPTVDNCPLLFTPEQMELLHKQQKENIQLVSQAYLIESLQSSPHTNVAMHWKKQLLDILDMHNYGLNDHPDCEPALFKKNISSFRSNPGADFLIPLILYLVADMHCTFQVSYSEDTKNDILAKAHDQLGQRIIPKQISDKSKDNSNIGKTDINNPSLGGVVASSTGSLNGTTIISKQPKGTLDKSRVKPLAPVPIAPLPSSVSSSLSIYPYSQSTTFSYLLQQQRTQFFSPAVHFPVLDYEAAFDPIKLLNSHLVQNISTHNTCNCIAQQIPTHPFLTEHVLPNVYDRFINRNMYMSKTTDSHMFSQLSVEANAVCKLISEQISAFANKVKKTQNLRRKPPNSANSLSGSGSGSKNGNDVENDNGLRIKPQPKPVYGIIPTSYTTDLAPKDSGNGLSSESENVIDIANIASSSIFPQFVQFLIQPLISCLDWNPSLYPQIQVTRRFKNRVSFLASEDALILLALSLFGFDDTESMSVHLLPCKTPNQISNRIQNLRARRAPANPVKEFCLQRIVPFNLLQEEAIRAGILIYGNDFKESAMEFLSSWPRSVIRHVWDRIFSSVVDSE